MVFEENWVSHYFQIWTPTSFVYALIAILALTPLFISHLTIKKWVKSSMMAGSVSSIFIDWIAIKILRFLQTIVGILSLPLAIFAGFCQKISTNEKTLIVVGFCLYSMIFYSILYLCMPSQTRQDQFSAAFFVTGIFSAIVTVLFGMISIICTIAIYPVCEWFLDL